jgi:hypothetical protein
MIKRLVKLSNHLDKKGLLKEADYLDAVIRKIALTPEAEAPAAEAGEADLTAGPAIKWFHLNDPSGGFYLALQDGKYYTYIDNIWRFGCSENLEGDGPACFIIKTAEEGQLKELLDENGNPKQPEGVKSPTEIYNPQK